MPDETTKSALSRLSEREARLIAELRDVQTAIRVLGGQPSTDDLTPAAGQEALGAANLHVIGVQSRTGAPEIRPDTFYGMSHHQAARKYLQMVGHADKLENILRGLQAGGVDIGGVRPSQTLRATLVQNSTVFEKVTASTFGLKEFYPHLGEKKVKAKVRVIRVVRKRPKRRQPRHREEGEQEKKAPE